jgi:beta-alanine degradation protein BauB
MTTSDATSDVGSRLLFENDHVKIWDLRLEPGQNLGMHRHTSEYALVVIGDGTLRSVNEDGSTRFEKDMPDGTVAYRALKTEDVHDAVNVGKDPWRNIVIEFKDRPCAE